MFISCKTEQGCSCPICKMFKEFEATPKKSVYMMTVIDKKDNTIKILSANDKTYKKIIRQIKVGKFIRFFRNMVDRIADLILFCRIKTKMFFNKLMEA